MNDKNHRPRFAFAPGDISAFLRNVKNIFDSTKILRLSKPVFQCARGRMIMNDYRQRRNSRDAWNLVRNSYKFKIILIIIINCLFDGNRCQFNLIKSGARLSVQKQVRWSVIRPCVQLCTRVTADEIVWDLLAPPFADQMSLFITHAAPLRNSFISIKEPRKITRDWRLRFASSLLIRLSRLLAADAIEW